MTILGSTEIMAQFHGKPCTIARAGSRKVPHEGKKEESKNFKCMSFVGQKVLVALMIFEKFKSGLEERKGAEMDRLIKDTFEKQVNCTVFVYKSEPPEKTFEYGFSFIQAKMDYFHLHFLCRKALL